MRKRTAGGKNIPLAVIILAFFHWFSYHYGALSQKKPVVQRTTGFFNEINPVGFVKCASRVKYGFAK